MRKYSILYFLFAFYFGSCNQKNREKMSIPINTSVALKSNTIESAHPVSDSGKIAILALDTSYFHSENLKGTVLSDKDLNLTEKILMTCLDNNNHDTSKQMLEYIDLRNYKRQYMPFLNKHGEKLVWVNCFCNTENFPNWKKEMVMVNDGGSCFFNVIINLTTKKYEHLFINGYA